MRHKFHAKPTKRDGFHFDSKKEANQYDKLCLARDTGVVLGFLRQVPLHFPGNVTYRMDFLVFYADGTAEGIEVKGYETKAWKVNKKLIAAHYPWLEYRVV